MGTRVKNDRGAVAPMIALTLAVLIPMLAITVDLGSQRVLRRDMQAVADMVALDMARLLDGRTATLLEQDPSWAKALQHSTDRNSSSVGRNRVVTAEAGQLVGNHFVRVEGSPATAVRVASKANVAFGFAPGFGAPGSGGAERSAIASSDSTACFSLGSYALGLDSENASLLNALIGDALDLGVLGYDGLANAQVSLLGLATELGAGSADELINLSGVSLGGFYLAAARALSKEGGDVADVSLLQTMAAGVGALPPIAISDLISLVQGGDSALATDVNVLDLVAASAFVAKDGSALVLPSVGVDLGITVVEAGMRILQQPQMACGRRGATTPNAVCPPGVSEGDACTSQVHLEVKGKLLNLPKILGVLSATASIDLSVDLASAKGRLTDIVCGAGTLGSPEGVDVAVTTALSEMKLSVPIKLTGDLGLVKVEISFNAEVGTKQPGGTRTAKIRIPESPTSYDEPARPGGVPTVGLSGLSVEKLGVTVKATLLGLPVVLPLPLASILGPAIELIVNPLVTNIDDALLGPLTKLLGLDVAGADVYGIPRPTCDTPALRG